MNEHLLTGVILKIRLFLKQCRYAVQTSQLPRSTCKTGACGKRG